MKCPNCGSEHVQFATHTKTKSFSLMDSCCGAIMLGPLGILCGLCGASSHTKEFWICHDCGYRFSTEKGKQNLENLRQSQLTYEQYKAELDSLYPTEGDYAQIRQKFQDASIQVDVMREQKKQFLQQLLLNPNPVVQHSAKVLLETGFAKVASFLFLGGLVLAGIGFLISFTTSDFLFKLGLFIFAVGIAAIIIFSIRDNSNEKKLRQLVIEFNSFCESQDAATATMQRYEDLTKKISYIESYEAQQH